MANEDHEQDWRVEKVTIKSSDYAEKLGLSGECRFYIAKGQIKIVQQDEKTSLTLQVSKIRFK